MYEKFDDVSCNSPKSKTYHGFEDSRYDIPSAMQSRLVNRRRNKRKLVSNFSRRDMVCGVRHNPRHPDTHKRAEESSAKVVSRESERLGSKNRDFRLSDHRRAAQKARRGLQAAYIAPHPQWTTDKVGFAHKQRGRDCS